MTTNSIRDDRDLHLGRRNYIFDFLGEMIPVEELVTSVGTLRLVHHPGLPPDAWGVVDHSGKIVHMNKSYDDWITEETK